MTGKEVVQGLLSIGVGALAGLAIYHQVEALSDKDPQQRRRDLRLAEKDASVAWNVAKFAR